MRTLLFVVVVIVVVCVAGALHCFSYHLDTAHLVGQISSLVTCTCFVENNININKNNNNHPTKS